ncbi:hypothetical protein [Moorena sp. SIOASIH]|nr:hypothetical protein [Moorena sp. SIOASIH]
MIYSFMVDDLPTLPYGMRSRLERGLVVRSHSCSSAIADLVGWANGHD